MAIATAAILCSHPAASHDLACFRYDPANSGCSPSNTKKPQRPVTVPSLAKSIVWQVPPVRLASRSQLVIHNACIYVPSWDGLRKLDARTGEEIWFFTPPPAPGKTFRVGTTVKGTDGKPKRVWKEQPNSIRGSIAISKGRVYCFSAGGLHCLEAGTGKLLWTNEYKEIFQQQPAIDEQSLYLASDMYVSAPENKRQFPQTYAAAIDLANGKIRWKAAVAPSGHNAIPAKEKDTVFFSELDGVRALNSISGKELWFRKTSGIGEDWPVTGAGKLFVVRDGKLQAFDTKTGKECWMVHDPKMSFSAPAVEGAVVYATAGGTIYAFDASSGKKKWNREYARVYGIATAPTIVGQLLLLPYNEVLYAINKHTGNMVWQLKLERLQINPLTSDGRLLFVMAKQGLLAINLDGAGSMKP